MNNLALVLEPTDIGEAQPHVHFWLLTLRQSQPRADVFDCGCGQRRKVYPGMDGVLPEIEVVEPNVGGSANNALYSADASTLGDPQADRLRSLLSLTGETNG